MPSERTLADEEEEENGEFDRGKGSSFFFSDRLAKVLSIFVSLKLLKERGISRVESSKS